MGLLVAGTKYRGEFEERLKKLMDEIKQNDDIILVSLQAACGVHGQAGRQADSQQHYHRQHQRLLQLACCSKRLSDLVVCCTSGAHGGAPVSYVAAQPGRTSWECMHASTFASTTHMLTHLPADD